MNDANLITYPRESEETKNGSRGAVNLIADPWEWPIEKPIRVKDRAWFERYRQFRIRLHWLLLWYDQVQILDVFPLFNRQIEQWVDNTPKEEGKEAQAKIEQLFGLDKALSVPLRLSKVGGSRFTTLQAVDEGHVRGNGDFIWYPDGRPREGFAKRLDRYLGLPDIESPTYTMERHHSEVQKAFETELGGGGEFSDLPNLLTSDATQQLLDLVGGTWRRSRLYDILGFGVSIDKNAKKKPRKPIIEVNPKARRLLRRIADASYHKAVDHDVLVPSRFPGRKPPIKYELMFPASSPGAILPEYEETLEVRSELFQRQIGAVCLTGNVGALFREFGNLRLEDIYKLRTHGPFTDYRDCSRQLNDDAAWENKDLLRATQNCSVECLRRLGQECDVPVERSTSGPVKIGFRIMPVGKKLLAYGLNFYFERGYGVKIPEFLFEAGIDVSSQMAVERIAWLTARFQRIERIAEPVSMDVGEFIGGVTGSDK